MALLHLGPASARAALARQGATGSYPKNVSRQTYFATRWIQPTRRVQGRRLFSQQQTKRPRPGNKIEWYPIPIALGVGFLGLMQGYKVYTREEKPEDETLEPKPKKRARIRPDGPWYGLQSIQCNRQALTVF